jgi:hypothetical protein
MSRATVFGLDVWMEETLPYLQGAGSPGTGRVLDVLIDRRDVPLEWPTDAELISAQQEPDGTFAIRIDAHEEAGYQLSGPRYGRHVLSRDGRRLRCVPDSTRTDDWQRFMIGQVLPFAAALNGLEVLHASAVTVSGGAVALLGASGAGKTSLALALCRRGAQFLADDVLALERRNGELFAHPGTPAAGVAHAEFARLAGRTPALETLAVNDRERLVRLPIARGPAPLSGVLFLDPTAAGPSVPCFKLVADPRALLASTFNFVLDDPQRLEGLLDVCALAAAGPVASVSFGSGVGSPRLAAAVMGWLEGLG